MIVISSSLVLALQAIDPDLPNRGVLGVNNKVTSTNVAATYTNSVYPVRNLAAPNTYQRWFSSNNTTDQFLTITLSGLELTDYLGVARHNFGSGQMSLTVQGYTNSIGAPSWVTLGQMAPGDDNSILFRFTPDYYRGIRLYIQPTAGVQYPYAAFLAVGKLVVFERGIYVGHTPITMGRNDEVWNGKSENGQFLGRMLTGSYLSTSVDLQNLTPDWYRANLDPALRLASTLPFFFAWRPFTYPLEAAFGWLTSNPRPTNARANGMMSVSFEMEAFK